MEPGEIISPSRSRPNRSEVDLFKGSFSAAALLLCLIVASCAPEGPDCSGSHSKGLAPSDPDLSFHVFDPATRKGGPDGISLGDFNDDGLLDVVVPFEEGGYTRLYLHPGVDRVEKPWTDIVQFPREARFAETAGSLNPIEVNIGIKIQAFGFISD